LISVSVGLNIPAAVAGFTRFRAGAFRHDRPQDVVEASTTATPLLLDSWWKHWPTHVVVETLTAARLGVPESVVGQVVDTAVSDGGVKIASPSGFVALKLFGGTMQDEADIVELIKVKRIDLSEFSLDSVRLMTFDDLKVISDRERLAYG
jgi:hypothetical protein